MQSCMQNNINLCSRKIKQTNQTYVIMPWLLYFLDWRNLLSFLLGEFSLFGRWDLRLSLGLVFCWFWLFLGLSGWHYSWCCGLGVSRLFGSHGCKRSTNTNACLCFLCLGLGWLGPLLSGGLVERALLTGWGHLTRWARRLVLGGRMRNGKRRIIETASWHQSLGLAVET